MRRKGGGGGEERGDAAPRPIILPGACLECVVDFL